MSIMTVNLIGYSVRPFKMTGYVTLVSLHGEVPVGWVHGTNGILRRVCRCTLSCY